jgi:hypothetical protein
VSFCAKVNITLLLHVEALALFTVIVSDSEYAIVTVFLAILNIRLLLFPEDAEAQYDTKNVLLAPVFVMTPAAVDVNVASLLAP